jgi:choline dehydrogenase
VVRQHLPGVSRNLQDHLTMYCVWQDQVPLPPLNNISESTVVLDNVRLRDI